MRRRGCDWSPSTAGTTTVISCRYFLPAESASDLALALFSFDSLARYEQYRALFGRDPEFIEADRIRDESGCVLRYERTFMRPLLPEQPVGGV